MGLYVESKSETILTRANIIVIIEILGVPGSGKTTLANQLEEELKGEVFCLKGRSSIPKLSICNSLSDYMSWVALRVIILGSLLLTPVTLIVFWKYLFFSFKQARKTVLSKSSNLSFLIYLLLLLSYQLTRYLLAIFISFSTKKNVIIDEGFYYNSIRLRQFTNPRISRELNTEYLHSLGLFKTDVIKIDITLELALQRFKLREQGAPPSLYSRWYVDQTNAKWIEKAWEEIEGWIDELVLGLLPRVISVDETAERTSKLKKISDYINANK